MSSGAHQQRAEPVMSNPKKVRHLATVDDLEQRREGSTRTQAPPSILDLERHATVLRIDCVRMLAVAKSGHLDSSLSAADIVAALYYRVLRHDPQRVLWPVARQHPTAAERDS